MTAIKNLILGACAAALLVSAPAQAADSKAFTPEQKAALEDYVRDFILNNPEIIIEAVNRFKASEEAKEEKDANASLSQYRDFIYNNKDMPQVGNPKGDVTIVEFFDYNCGYCHRAYEGIQQTLQEDKNVRFVFIDLPILSPDSRTSAEWALAAQKQGKYWDFHKAVMEFKGPKSVENLTDIAKKIGLNVEQLQKDAASEEIKTALDKHSEVAQALRVSGTPGFIVGDQIVRGYLPYDGMKAVIADVRKGGKTKTE